MLRAKQMLRRYRIIVTLFVLVACASVAAAQGGAGREPEGLTRGLNEFGTWGGVALFDSLNLIGSEEEKSARLGLVALRYARVLAAGHGLAFKYTIDGGPLALLRYDRVRFLPTATPNVFPLAPERKTAYGAGLAPIGL